jgi:ubiquinone/menaquinone biosynthesis C-methylase UbiE
MSRKSINPLVKEYWEAQPCGTETDIFGDSSKYTKEWFEIIENYRYEVEPFIHSIAQFTRFRGKRVLEIGVGAGTDHLQWARAGVDLFGIDLTNAGVEITERHLAMYGLKSNLKRVDAEILPFEDNSFDVVYSWGVIHHSENPQAIVNEIKRVLKPNGVFIGMFYNRRSLAGIVAWLKFALLKGRPWRSISYVLYHHNESIGTKAYTNAELKNIFKDFSTVKITPLITISDYTYLPKFLKDVIPPCFGYYSGIQVNINSQIEK